MLLFVMQVKDGIIYFYTFEFIWYSCITNWSIALCCMRVKREDVSENVKGFINVPLPPHPPHIQPANLRHLEGSCGDSSGNISSGDTLNCAVTETLTRRGVLTV